VALTVPPPRGHWAHRHLGGGQARHACHGGPLPKLHSEAWQAQNRSTGEIRIILILEGLCTGPPRDAET